MFGFGGILPVVEEDRLWSQNREHVSFTYFFGNKVQLDGGSVLQIVIEVDDVIFQNREVRICFPNQARSIPQLHTLERGCFENHKLILIAEAKKVSIRTVLNVGRINICVPQFL